MRYIHSVGPGSRHREPGLSGLRGKRVPPSPPPLVHNVVKNGPRPNLINNLSQKNHKKTFHIVAQFWTNPPFLPHIRPKSCANHAVSVSSRQPIQSHILEPSFDEATFP